VAQMAGMPNQVVLRAGEIMEHLEKDKVKEKNQAKIKELPKPYQINLFESADPNYAKVKEMLKNLDINTMSPVEALLKLNEIRNIVTK
jgi:DNA mismatch repair protein MutS